jgi:hypothetical protein
MLELGDMNRSDFQTTSSHFDYKIEKAIEEGKFKRPKVLLYNTNYGFFFRLMLRFRHGFKTIGSYKGRESRVFVTIKKI